MLTVMQAGGWLVEGTDYVTGEVITVAGGMEGRTLWERGDVDVGEMRRRWEEGAE